PCSFVVRPPTINTKLWPYTTLFRSKEELYETPKHPYTKALLSAIPLPDPDEYRERIILKGDVPSPSNPPKGCPFHTRCPKAMDICKEISPHYQLINDKHYVACHLYD